MGGEGQGGGGRAQEGRPGSYQRATREILKPMISLITFSFIIVAVRSGVYISNISPFCLAFVPQWQSAMSQIFCKA